LFHCKEESSVGVDQTQYRQVMGHFASGVTVVTTACEGQLAGLTVSSFTSLSLNPTLVLVCVADYASSRGAIAEAGQFAVNILTEDQQDVSRRFADPHAERFPAGSYVLSAHGLPLFPGSLATLECTVTQALPGGDHTIFIGEVFDAQINSGRPLLYYRSGYRRLSEPE
jgi:flavin reductase (DIM6/NTAB) family NADH-FMN oxidoreductase RutF